MTWAHAGQYGPESFSYPSGATATVVVWTLRTLGGDVADVWVDRDRSAAAANPGASDGSGDVSLFADPGSYQLVVDGGYGVKTFDIVVPPDPADLGTSGATPVGTFVDGAMDAATWAFIAGLGAPGSYVIDQTCKFVDLDISGSPDGGFTTVTPGSDAPFVINWGDSAATIQAASGYTTDQIMVTRPSTDDGDTHIRFATAQAYTSTPISDWSVVDSWTGGSVPATAVTNVLDDPPAAGIYTLDAATWAFVRALVPNELIEVLDAVTISFDDEGGPRLYVVQGDGMMVAAVGSLLASAIDTGTQPGLTQDLHDQHATNLGFEGYLDLNRYADGYWHDADLTGLYAGSVALWPVSRDGHTIVAGETFVVIGASGTHWFGTSDAGTGIPTFDTTNTNPLTGGGRFRTPVVSGEFRDNTRRDGAEVFGTTDATGVWMIGPWPMSGSGAPADTLGEDGCTYDDIDSLDRYLKVSGAWRKFTLAGLV